jgi:hypothetical protein
MLASAAIRVNVLRTNGLEFAARYSAAEHADGIHADAGARLDIPHRVSDEHACDALTPARCSATT